jgi:hypothetical protein
MQNVLQYLRKHIFEIQMIFFDRRELSALDGKIDRNVIHLPCVPSFLDGSVVQLAANVQRPKRFSLEIVVWSQFVLKRFLPLLEANIPEKVNDDIDLSP